MAEAPTGERIKLVNTGRGPINLAEGILKPNSANSIEVSKADADKYRRAYPHVKNIADIFPDASADIAKLQAEHEALKKKAASLESLLGISDQAKVDLQAKVDDLTGRLKEFLEAGSKKDLDALQEKHAEAVPAAAPETTVPQA